MKTPQTIVLKLAVSATDSGAACDLLAAASGLSKTQIKDAMNKGAVRLHSGKRQKLLRRARYTPRAGEQLELHYDPAILALVPPPVHCIADERRYSVWEKPVGMLSQGSLWGDHCALTRIAEKHFQPPREVFLVHRLDREATGLMLLAHDKRAAAALSQLFQRNAVYKAYQTRVRGRPEPEQGRIDFPLEGKTARSEYRLLDYSADSDTATLEVIISTGRKHQIRRHLEMIGHPVLGDPLYGQGNKSKDGLQLAAVELAFENPFGAGRKAYRLDQLSAD